jgi:superfamily II DNA or RNA helicase
MPAAGIFSNLRHWQQQALPLWLEHRRGIVKVVTGAGKTTFALACFAEMLRADASIRAVVIVPTHALADQWADATAAGLRIPRDQIAGPGESWSHARVVILVVNSARKQVRLLTGGGDWMLIVDECHRAASPANRGALRGRFVATLGLSATPERAYDSYFEDVLVPALGPVIYEYAYSSALRDGVLSPFSVDYVRVPLLANESEAIDAVSSRIARRLAAGDSIDDPELVRLMIRRAQISQGAESRVPAAIHLALASLPARGFIFHETIARAEQIAEGLTNQGARVATYHSKLSSSSQLRALRLFRTRQVDFLVTCKALDEGIDVPSASLGIIAASTSSQRQRVQRFGRVLRPAPGKKIAYIKSLYALDLERSRLEDEAKLLEGLADVRWLRADFS